jgi:hypothetical protein
VALARVEFRELGILLHDAGRATEGGIDVHCPHEAGSKSDNCSISYGKSSGERSRWLQVESGQGSVFDPEFISASRFVAIVTQEIAPETANIPLCVGA